VHTIVVRLSDLAFLSQEDIENEANLDTLGEKILRHFAFLPGELSDAISDGATLITYQEPTREQLDEAKRLAIQGSQKANQRDFHAAADLYTKALAANPAMPETHRDLAMARYELGDFTAAKDHSIDALRLAPADAWNHVVLANIFTRENALSSAIRFFNRALELKPGDPYALNGLGAAHAKSGHDTQAHECFDAAIAAHPDMIEPRFGKGSPSPKTRPPFRVRRSFGRLDRTHLRIRLGKPPGNQSGQKPPRLREGQTPRTRRPHQS
jgi:tetratricopeptide (TPR) repeat protein